MLCLKEKIYFSLNGSFFDVIRQLIYILEIMGVHARCKQENQEKEDKNGSCFKRGDPL